jgi:hypothetical protein
MPKSTKGPFEERKEFLGIEFYSGFSSEGKFNKNGSKSQANLFNPFFFFQYIFSEIFFQI